MPSWGWKPGWGCNWPYVIDVVVGEVERSEGGSGREQAEVGDRVVGQVQVLLKIIWYIWTFLNMFGYNWINMDIYCPGPAEEIQTNFPGFRKFGSELDLNFQWLFNFQSADEWGMILGLTSSIKKVNLKKMNGIVFGLIPAHAGLGDRRSCWSGCLPPALRGSLSS